MKAWFEFFGTIVLTIVAGLPPVLLILFIFGQVVFILEEIIMLDVERTQTEQGQYAQKRDIGFETDGVTFVGDVDNGKPYCVVHLKGKDTEEEAKVHFPVDMPPWKVANYIVEEWQDDLSLEDLK